MAASKVTRGDGLDVYLMGNPYGGAPSGAFTNTTPQVSSQDDTSEVDGLSLHLIVDFAQDEISIIAGTDAVVASTGVWTFGNYTFTGLVGAKLIVSGAANAGNNGTFSISAVSGNTATTATTGLVNETFGPNVVVFVMRSEAASVPQGTWTIQGANDFVSGATVGGNGGATQYGMPGQPGNWPNITAMFTVPATIAAVTTAGSQIVCPAGHFSIKNLRATFTPSSGRGTARVARFAKSWSR